MEPPIGAKKGKSDRTSAIATNKAASMYGRIRRLLGDCLMSSLYNKKGVVRTTTQKSPYNTLEILSLSLYRRYSTNLYEQSTRSHFLQHHEH